MTIGRTTNKTSGEAIFWDHDGALEIFVSGEPQFGDAGLKHLKGLTGLQYLDLAGTKVTGPGLEHMKGLIVYW